MSGNSSAKRAAKKAQAEADRLEKLRKEKDKEVQLQKLGVIKRGRFGAGGSLYEQMSGKNTFG